MANKQVRYSHQQVGLKPDMTVGSYNTLFGVQDVGISTNFNLQQYFELGQLELYDQIEGLADIQVTISKILDGKPLIWHRSTQGSTAGPSLINRSSAKCILGMAIFDETNDSASGTPGNIVECSGLFPSSISYTLNTNDAFAESMTLVGNDIIWKGDNRILNTADLARRAGLTYAGDAEFASNNDSPLNTGIELRQNLVFSYDAGDGLDVNGQIKDPDATILPREILGISDSGTNETSAEGVLGAHISSITVSTELGREPFNELGRRLPYHRQANFPTEVTCAIETYSVSGANISATENGIFSVGGSCSSASNLQNQTIRIASCGGLRIYLGTKNRLASIDQGGGGIDGSPQTITYNYSNFNSFTVMHISETGINPSGLAWWNNRAYYLT
jgi:hypothetical protein